MPAAVQYERIVKNVCSLLRDGHTATFVVGNLRGKDGRMLNLHQATCKAFEDADCVQVNDAILCVALGTAPMRAARTASAASKLVPVHQNIVVYAKGEMLTPAVARRAGIRANNESQGESQND